MNWKLIPVNDSWIKAKYTCQTELWNAEILNFLGDWQYYIGINIDLKKKIVNSSENGKKIISLKQAKEEVKIIFELLDKANIKGNAWILKGIQLGFTTLEQMAHLEKIYKK